MKSTIIYFHFCSRRSYNMCSHAVLYVISPFLPFSKDSNILKFITYPCVYAYKYSIHVEKVEM